MGRRDRCLAWPAFIARCSRRSGLHQVGRHRHLAEPARQVEMMMREDERQLEDDGKQGKRTADALHGAPTAAGGGPIPRVARERASLHGRLSSASA